MLVIHSLLHIMIVNVIFYKILNQLNQFHILFQHSWSLAFHFVFLHLISVSFYCLLSHLYSDKTFIISCSLNYYQMYWIQNLLRVELVNHFFTIQLYCVSMMCWFYIMMYLIILILLHTLQLLKIANKEQKKLF